MLRSGRGHAEKDQPEPPPAGAPKNGHGWPVMAGMTVAQELLTAAVAAPEAGVSVRTMRRWANGTSAWLML